jgi:anti-anti-sigma regulatory factor
MTQPSTTPPGVRAAPMLNPQVVLTGLIATIIVATLGMLIIGLVGMDIRNIALSAVALIFFGGLLAAHLRGWRYSPHATVIAAVAFTIAGNPPSITMYQLSFTVLIPSVLAAMFLPWYWTVGAFLVCVGGVGAQTGFTGPLFRADSMLLALIVVVGSAAAGAFGRSAQRTAEERADLLAVEKGRAEAQARELAEANELMETQLDQQQQLLDLVATLETPAVQVAEGVLLVPVIGHIDNRRAQSLTQKLLQEVYAQRARFVIFDVAGVAVMDTTVAHAVLNTMRAIRLLGCVVILSGISADVAMALTHLGVNLDEMRTVRTPQEALVSIVESRAHEATNGRHN